MLYHQYGRTLEKLADSKDLKTWRQHRTTCDWLYGTTGTGKSARAFQDYHPDTHYKWEMAMHDQRSARVDGAWRQRPAALDRAPRIDCHGHHTPASEASPLCCAPCSSGGGSGPSGAGGSAAGAGCRSRGGRGLEERNPMSVAADALLPMLPAIANGCGCRAPTHGASRLPCTAWCMLQLGLALRLLRDTLRLLERDRLLPGQVCMKCFGKSG